MAIRKEAVASKLAELREQHDLSQEQAAARVGITHRQWQRWEHGESVPYPRNLDAIAARFGFDVSEFFDQEDMPALRAAPDNQLDRIEGKLDMLIDFWEVSKGA